MPFGSFWIHKEEQEKESSKAKKRERRKNKRIPGRKPVLFSLRKNRNPLQGRGRWDIGCRYFCWDAARGLSVIFFAL